ADPQAGERRAPHAQACGALSRTATTASEPVRLADGAHRRALGLLVEAVDVELTVEVVGLVLERLRHGSRATQLDRAAVEVDTAHPGEGMPHPLEVEPGHREAALVDELGLARDLDELGVDDVADPAIDVVAEHAQVDAAP